MNLPIVFENLRVITCSRLAAMYSNLAKSYIRLLEIKSKAKYFLEVPEAQVFTDHINSQLRPKL